MKKELIICTVVIISVIIGNIITQNYTKQCVANMDEELTELKLKMKERNVESEDIEKVKTNWSDMQENLAFYIEHDELEKVETQLFLLQGFIEAKLYDNTFAEIEKCNFILEHIADKTALNVKNIF